MLALLLAAVGAVEGGVAAVVHFPPSIDARRQTRRAAGQVHFALSPTLPRRVRKMQRSGLWQEEICSMSRELWPSDEFGLDVLGLSHSFMVVSLSVGVMRSLEP
jgi:hypothetical protein